MSNIEKKVIDTIRVISAEAIEKANSGHPGMPMGGADYAFTLWNKYLQHNPAVADWDLRDRFILSTGHGSMLIYSLLHLFEYGLTMDDLKQFRQLDSLTPGHPEYKHTRGVDITTGPLGSGFASGVGMAMSAKLVASKMGNDELFNQKIFIIVGDGCMMEGCTSEAASLAGHLKLDNIICFYDDNQITIEGSTDLAFSENVPARFNAYGWNTIEIDGHNVEEINNALSEARSHRGSPTLIIGKTKIGKGSPNKEGKACAHGAPLGADELIATKENLGFPTDKDFYVPAEVYAHCSNRVKELQKEAELKNEKLNAFFENNPEKATLYNDMKNKDIPANLLDELLAVIPDKEAIATRASSGIIMQKIAELIPSFYGGAADLAPSTKTDIKSETSFSASNYSGKNFHFGVRELAMGLFGNGMALYGMAIPYTSTFFVFSDYMKPAIRLAAIQGLKEIYVFTHDSFYVGEDGPTHEPIEQISMLRSIPGLTVLRPAESNEVAHAWNTALKCEGPVAILLTRQDLRTFDSVLASKIDMQKGAYILSEDANFDIIMMSTGSEVNATLDAADILRGKGAKIRVVSMPSWELFDAQSLDYKESVLPDTCQKRVSVEAASGFGWERYTGRTGLIISINHFGASAPYKALIKKYGFNPEQIASKVRDFYKI